MLRDPEKRKIYDEVRRCAGLCGAVVHLKCIGAAAGACLCSALLMAWCSMARKQ